MKKQLHIVQDGLLLPLIHSKLFLSKSLSDGTWKPILFDRRVESAINQIVVNPKIYPASGKNKLRKCIIHKNTSLIYRINKRSIELIVFVNNRSEHGF